MARIAGEGTPGTDRLIGSDRIRFLGPAFCLLALVAWIDREFISASLAILYVFPVLLISVVLNRAQIVGFSLFCAWLRAQFYTPDSTLDAALGFGLATIAYSTTGLFVSLEIEKRRLMAQHLREIERQQSLRREAEEHLRVLAESSPAAIFTLDENGFVLSANKAFVELLGLPPLMEPVGLRIASYLPVLADALALDTRDDDFRTGAQCQGRRHNEELFVAQVWFSTYSTPEGRRLAAIAVDISEETREREEQNLRQLLSNNRIIAGAVSHEIRNVCAAISMVHRGLARVEGLRASDDFQALGRLVDALSQIASTELHAKVKPQLSFVDLRELLAHLRIVIEPAWKDVEGQIFWSVPDEPLPVLAESYGLLQAMLNLAQNSLRAVEVSERRELTVSVVAQKRIVTIVFEDTGCGVASPARLFQPFHQGAESSGLGLYVSRAIVRSYGGELHYEAATLGSRFVIELPAAGVRSTQTAVAAAPAVASSGVIS